MPDTTDTQCPMQAVFGHDNHMDCTFERGHDGPHSYLGWTPEIPEHDCTYPPNGFLETGGPCVICGAEKPLTRNVMVDEALLRSALRDALTLAQALANSGDPEAPDFIAEYETALLELAAATPAPVARTEWGVAYETDGHAPLFGVREYDSREDAEAMVASKYADVVVARTVTATPWQRAAEVAADA